MFEIRDAAGLRLAMAVERSDAESILRAFVATAPGREDEIFLVTVDPDGLAQAREDIFDL